MTASAQCLLLNKNFYAFDIMGAYDALSLLYQGHVEAVDENCQTYDFASWVELSKAMKEMPNGVVKAVGYEIAIPEVIRAIDYKDIPKPRTHFSRRNLYSHYKNTCCYCSKKCRTSELNLDHVKPRGQGGGNGWDNVVLSCIPCNSKKGCRTPEQAGMKLRVKPTKPRPMPIQKRLALRLPIKLKRCVAWQQFIDKSYWDSELEE